MWAVSRPSALIRKDGNVLKESGSLRTVQEFRIVTRQRVAGDDLPGVQKTNGVGAGNRTGRKAVRNSDEAIGQERRSRRGGRRKATVVVEE